MVAVLVREEQRGEEMGRDAAFHEAQHGRAPGVELQCDVAVAHEGARSRAARNRERHARARERDGRGRVRVRAVAAGLRAHRCFPGFQPPGVSSRRAMSFGVSSRVVAIVSFQRLRKPNSAHTATMAVIWSSV